MLFTTISCRSHIWLPLLRIFRSKCTGTEVNDIFLFRLLPCHLTMVPTVSTASLYVKPFGVARMHARRHWDWRNLRFCQLRCINTCTSGFCCTMKRTFEWLDALTLSQSLCHFSNNRIWLQHFCGSLCHFAWPVQHSSPLMWLIEFFDAGSNDYIWRFCLRHCLLLFIACTSPDMPSYAQIAGVSSFFPHCKSKHLMYRQLTWRPCPNYIVLFSNKWIKYAFISFILLPTYNGFSLLNVADTNLDLFLHSFNSEVIRHVQCPVAYSDWYQELVIFYEMMEPKWPASASLPYWQVTLTPCVHQIHPGTDVDLVLSRQETFLHFRVLGRLDPSHLEMNVGQ